MINLISFELAKLLKEKGIIFETEICYSSVTKATSVSYTEIAAPTIAEVVMWLYEKYSLWILVLPTVTGDFAYKVVDIQLDPEKSIERPPYKDVSANDYDSPTQAYSAAIEYVLKNLI